MYVSLGWWKRWKRKRVWKASYIHESNKLYRIRRVNASWSQRCPSYGEIERKSATSRWCFRCLISKFPCGLQPSCSQADKNRNERIQFSLIGQLDFISATSLASRIEIREERRGRRGMGLNNKETIYLRSERECHQTWLEKAQNRVRCFFA